MTADAKRTCSMLVFALLRLAGSMHEVQDVSITSLDAMLSSPSAFEADSDAGKALDAASATVVLCFKGQLTDDWRGAYQRLALQYDGQQSAVVPAKFLKLDVAGATAAVRTFLRLPHPVPDDALLLVLHEGTIHRYHGPPVLCGMLVFLYASTAQQIATATSMSGDSVLDRCHLSTSLALQRAGQRHLQRPWQRSRWTGWNLALAAVIVAVTVPVASSWAAIRSKRAKAPFQKGAQQGREQQSCVTLARLRQRGSLALPPSGLASSPGSGSVITRQRRWVSGGSSSDEE